MSGIIQPLFMSSVKTSNAVVNYITNSSDTTAQTTYSFTLSGTYTAGLHVVGIICENSTISGRTLSLGTFAGSAMTSVINTAINTGGSGSLVSALFQYKLASSTTNPVVTVTFSAGMTRCNIGVWRIDSNNSDTVFTTATSSISGTATSRSNTLVGLGNGYVGISLLANGNATTTSWTGATERYELAIAGTGGAGADFTNATVGSRTITATATSGVNDGLILVSGAWA